MRSKDYSNTKIYKLYFGDDTYIGHTTNMPQRIRTHKYSLTKLPNLPLYKRVTETGGFDNWTWDTLETFNAGSLEGARLKEREWIEKLKPNLNVSMPSRTHAQYVDDNRENIKAWRREWQKDYNKRPDVKQYRTQYNSQYLATDAGKAHLQKQNQIRKNRRLIAKQFRQLPFDF